MIYIMDLGGIIRAASASSINQGESGASEIVLLAPYPSYTSVRVNLQLPNKLILPPVATDPTGAFTMAALSEFNDFAFIRDAAGNPIGYNAWKYTVQYPITQSAGNVTLSFVLTSPEGVEKTSTSVVLPINRGTPSIPQPVSEDDLTIVATWAAQAERAVTNAATAANEAISAKDEAISAKDEAVAAKVAIGGMLNGFEDELIYLETEVVTLNAEKADKTEVSALETRVNLIEGALIEFDTDNSTEYKKPVPLTSAHKAYINSINGKTIGGVGANKFDPYWLSDVFDYGFEVMPDGSIVGQTNREDDAWYPLTINLPAGTWTISETGNRTLGLAFENSNVSETTITLSVPSEVTLTYALYYGHTEYSFKVMIYNVNDAPTDFEPYEYGPAAVTAIKSYSANLVPFPYSYGGVGNITERNGLVFTVKEDRGIEIKGTATAGNYYSVAKAELGTSDMGGDAVAQPQFTNGQYSISSRLFYNPNNKVVSINFLGGQTINDVIYPMANKGSTLLPYRPYFAPETYEIPSEMIDSLDGYGYSMPDGTHPNVLDLDAKKYIQNTEVLMSEGRAYDFEVLAEPRVTDVSQYLTDLMPNGYFSVTVQGGGEIEFVNDYSEPVPSEVTFLLAP